MKISSMLRVFLYLSIAILTAGQHVDAQDRSQGRSMVISRNGIVAAESPLAAQAGVRILERGGNAVDAAIATNAMMGVVEPMMNGIGGDLFAIVYDAKADKLYGINASGWAPKGLTIEYLQKQGIRSTPQQGVNAITVPGAVDGWQKLADKFGRKKLAEDLAAAIRTAQDGFPVPEWTAAYWASEVDYLRTDEAAQRADDRARPGRVFQRIRGAHLDDIPRLDDLRVAAQRAGPRSTGNAEYHGDVSARAKGLGIRLDESAACHD